MNFIDVYDRDYDNPYNDDGTEREKKLLGRFWFIETLEDGLYDSIRIAMKEEGGIYLVIENEVSGYKGGSRTRVIKIKSLDGKHEITQKDSCTWTEDPDGIWHTSCGQAHEFNTGTPEENDHLYCPYCGNMLDVSRQPVI